MDAPAQVHEEAKVTTAPQPEPSTLLDVFGMFLFFVLSIAAVWYGWKYGIEWAPAFWTKIQNYGLALGKMFGNKPSFSNTIINKGNQFASALKRGPSPSFSNTIINKGNQVSSLFRRR